MVTQKQIAAIFDVDGTLIAGTSLEQIFIKYLLRRGEMKLGDLLRFSLGMIKSLAEGRAALRANKFYLRGKEAQRVRKLARECFEAEIAPRLLDGGVERLRWHQQAGHLVILLSGTLNCLLEPLAEHLGVFAHIGTQLESEGRILTGRIAGPHPYGETKAEILRDLNAGGAIDVKRSFAYADRYSDRHLLALVGNPVATNADDLLHQLAESKGWMREVFTCDGPRRLTGRTYDQINSGHGEIG